MEKQRQERVENERFPDFSLFLRLCSLFLILLKLNVFWFLTNKITISLASIFAITGNGQRNHQQICTRHVVQKNQGLVFHLRAVDR